MNVDNFLQHYEEGSVVISPYGLAVVTKLFDEPFHARPKTQGDHCWPLECENPDLTAATIWVNGHGEETIEIDQLVPATPDTMARWQLQTEESDD